MIVQDVYAKEFVYNLATQGVLNNGSMYCEHSGTVCYKQNLHYWNKINIPAGIYGEYYIQEFITNGTFPHNNPSLFQPNPYCISERLRPSFFPVFAQTSILEEIQADIPEDSYNFGEAYLRQNITNSVQNITNVFEDHIDSTSFHQNYVCMFYFL